MAKFIALVAILLVVLPALIAASACKLSVTSKLSDTQNRYNVYTATINNVGTATAANIAITPSSSLRDVSGLKSSDNAYTLTSKQIRAGGIAAGSTLTFTYTASKGNNIKWTASCTDGASTSPATSAPTNKAATSAPTNKAATSAPTNKAATSAPTNKAATSAPTNKAATSAPTVKGATAAPTNKAATTAPTANSATNAPSAGGKICPAGTWWQPAPQTTWQWQLNNAIDQSYNVQMYDIELFDNSAATIASLHAKGKVVICYFSTQYENWRPDASSFPSSVIGNNLDDWAGEKWVDIRSTTVRNIMAARLDLAVQKGCDGVEPDNVDSYEANSGFPLTAANQLDYNKWLANAAHARGLSVGLKNDLSQVSTLEPFFDWAINEQCKEYSECSQLNTFVNKGKAVFNCEYSGSASSVCPAMVTSKFSSIIKNLNLDATIKAQCCTYQSNGCANAAYKCVSSSATRDAEEEETNTYAAQALEAKEITHEAPKTNSATTSFASIAFVAVAAVAAMNLNL